MVVLAIFVSRFEAITVASMLRAYGVPTWVDGEAHASAEYISQALGGHRLRVMAADYKSASAIIRDAGLADAEYVPVRPNTALLKLIGLAFAAYSAIFGSLVATGGASAAYLLLIPFSVYQIPVDPKGPPDYFLKRSSE